MLAYALSLTLSAADGGHEVLALLERQAAAWSKGDLDGFCSVYADDAVFVAPSGVTKGRAEVLARYKKKYPTSAAMGRLTLSAIDVRESAEVVSVAAKWTLEYPEKPGAEPAQRDGGPPQPQAAAGGATRSTATGHTVVVFKRVAGQWKIVHDASM